MNNDILINNYTDSLLSLNLKSKYCNIDVKESFKMKNINFIIQNHFNSNIENSFVEDYFIYGNIPLETLNFLSQNYREYNSWIIVFLTIVIAGFILFMIKLFLIFKKSKSKTKSTENKKFCLYLVIFLIFPISVLLMFYSSNTIKMIYENKFNNSACQLKYIKNKVIGNNVNKNQWVNYFQYFDNLNNFNEHIEKLNNYSNDIIKYNNDFKINLNKEIDLFNNLEKYMKKLEYNATIFENDKIINKKFKSYIYEDQLKNENSEISKFKTFIKNLNSTFIDFFSDLTNKIKIFQEEEIDIDREFYIYNENYYNVSKVLIYYFNKMQVYYESFIDDHEKYMFRIKYIIYFILVLSWLNFLNFLLFIIKKDNKYMFLINIFWVLFYFIGLFSLYEITNFAERGGLYSKGCKLLDNNLNNNDYFINSIKYLNITNKDYYFISTNSKNNTLNHNETTEYLEYVINKYNEKQDPFNFNYFMTILNKLNFYFNDLNLINKIDNFEFINSNFTSFKNMLNKMENFNISSNYCTNNKIKNCLDSYEYLSLENLNSLTNQKKNPNLNCTIFEDDYNFNTNNCLFKNITKSNQNCYKISDLDVSDINEKYNNETLNECNKINDNYIYDVIPTLFLDLKKYQLDYLDNIKFIKENLEEIENKSQKIWNNLNQKIKTFNNLKQKHSAVTNDLRSINTVNSLKNLKEELFIFKENLCNNDFNIYIGIFEYYGFIPIFCFILMILGYSISFLINTDNNNYSLFFDNNNDNSKNLELKTLITNVSIESDSFYH